jgi:hypothetical protein
MYRDKNSFYTLNTQQQLKTNYSLLTPNQQNLRAFSTVPPPAKSQPFQLGLSVDFGGPGNEYDAVQELGCKLLPVGVLCVRLGQFLLVRPVPSVILSCRHSSRHHRGKFVAIWWGIFQWFLYHILMFGSLMWWCFFPSCQPFHGDSDVQTSRPWFQKGIFLTEKSCIFQMESPTGGKCGLWPYGVGCKSESRCHTLVTNIPGRWRWAQGGRDTSHREGWWAEVRQWRRWPARR